MECQQEVLEAGDAQIYPTVDVISDEQTSQTYLIPPSVPRVPVFFLITPMALRFHAWGAKAAVGEQSNDRIVAVR